MRKHKKPRLEDQTNNNFSTPIPKNNQILQINDDGTDLLTYESETEHLLSLIEGATDRNPVIIEEDDDDDDDDDDVEITKVMFKGQCSNSKVEINKIDDDVGCYPVLFVCEICSDSLPVHYKFAIKGCDHFYCSICIGKYVSSKIDENVCQIGCPDSGCNGRLELEGCRGVLTKKVYDRWNDRLCEGMILGSQKFYCPFKDCSALLIDDGGGGVIRSSECPYCRRLFCAQCKVKWHADIDCASFQELRGDEREREDILLMNLAKAKSWMILGSQKFYCPFKDCSALLIDDGGGGVIRESKCPYCNRFFCAQCKVPWHDGIDCANFQELRGDEREREDILLLNLAKAESWRRCPSCRFYVERTEGCLFMHCRCGYNFCYSCGGHLVDHYCQVCKR